jgi:EF hand
MRNSILTFTALFFLTVFIVGLSSGVAAAQQGVGPSDAAAKEAFKSILSSADTNKDGKLSTQECFAIWKDKKMAEKNCRYWDANGDGTITEEEYVKQSKKLMK